MHAGISPDHPSRPAEATHGASTAERVSPGTPGLCHVRCHPPPPASTNTHFCRNSSKPQILSTKSSTSMACSSSCV